MDESCFVMLSALQHYAFCPRQCALIHLEQIWVENAHTVEGTLMHQKAHSGQGRIRDGIKIATDVPLKCQRLGLTGKADVVEFCKNGKQWIPYPIEYKKGRPHKGCDADLVQLCGQALCLEEMLDVHIPEGALFYGKTHRRHVVIFDTAMRKRTEAVVYAVHRLFEECITPLPQINSACKSCSLNQLCMPEITSTDNTRASQYVHSLCEKV